MLGLRQRPLTLWFGAACVAAALTSACGKSPSLADQLSPSGSVTVTALSISFNTPSVGSGVQAIATATFSSGSTTPIASGFGTDTPSVATVSSSGGVTGVSIGDVTIFVDYQGMRASKRVRVLPGYGGTFAGTYAVGTCVATGGFASPDPAEHFCTEFTTGRQLSIAMQSAQSADLTTVTGQFALGNAVGTGAGTISSTGTLTYSGAIAFAGDTTRMDLRNWTATSPAPGRIAGSFEMVWTDSTVSGSGIITATNMDMVRQSASFPQPVSPRGRLLDRTSLVRLLLQK